MHIDHHASIIEMESKLYDQVFSILIDPRSNSSYINMLMPLKSLHQHWGKPPVSDLSASPFPFGVVAPTGCNGTIFRVIYELMDDWFVMYNVGDKCITLQCKNIQR